MGSRQGLDGSDIARTHVESNQALAPDQHRKMAAHVSRQLHAQLTSRDHFFACRSTEEKFLVMPTLLWLHARIGLTVTEMLTAVSLAGMGSSLLMAIGCNNLLITSATWLLYLSLYAVGQTFLSFQWDILLLEVGWAAVLLAPLPGGLTSSCTYLCMLLSHCRCSHQPITNRLLHALYARAHIKRMHCLEAFQQATWC